MLAIVIDQTWGGVKPTQGGGLTEGGGGHTAEGRIDDRNRKISNRGIGVGPKIAWCNDPYRLTD